MIGLAGTTMIIRRGNRAPSAPLTTPSEELMISSSRHAKSIMWPPAAVELTAAGDGVASHRVSAHVRRCSTGPTKL